jgi:hypothetical protein
VTVKRVVLLAAVVAVVGGGLVWSATGQPREDAGPPALGEVRRVSTGRDVVLPFDSYRHPSTEVNTIERATAVLAKQCMTRFGHDWPLPMSDAVDPTVHTSGGRYGIVDATEVATRGYHAAEEPAEQRTADPQQPLDAVMVYTGKGATTVGGQAVPEGGCVGEARRKLEEGVPQGLAGADFAALDRSLYEEAQVDGRVQQAMSGWRDCMAAAGYQYADVWAANDDVRWSAPAPTPEEIAVATTDVACREKTGLTATWLAVETAYQQRTITERAAEFDALRQGMRVRLANAARV